MRKPNVTDSFLNFTVACALALCVCVAAHSGEEKPPPPPPPPVPAAPGTPETPVSPDAPPPITGADKTAIANILDENYVFDDNNRRDPFTFTKAVVSIDDGGPKGDDKIDLDKRLPKEVVEEKRRVSEQALSLAEAALMDLDPITASAQCDVGMEKFKDIPDISIYPELEVVKGRILRARKAGDQMRSRINAERDFYALNIKINGVMVNKKNSQAIVNSKVVRKGDLVSTTSDATDVMVDEILSERVVFTFRGYRMTLLVAEAGGR